MGPPAKSTGKWAAPLISVRVQLRFNGTNYVCIQTNSKLAPARVYGALSGNRWLFAKPNSDSRAETARTGPTRAESAGTESASGESTGAESGRGSANGSGGLQRTEGQRRNHRIFSSVRPVGANCRRHYASSTAAL